MSCSIHAGDVGSKIYVDIIDCEGEPVDVSSATVTLYLTRPRTAEVIPSLPMIPSTELASGDRAAAAGDGSDGRMMYVTTSGQINVAGRWRGQPRIVEGATIFWGKEFAFEVLKTAAL